jgi:hypothetical protein
VKHWEIMGCTSWPGFGAHPLRDNGARIGRRVTLCNDFTLLLEVVRFWNHLDVAV